MNLLVSLLLSLLPSVDGYIWAWMLSMPYDNPEDAAGLAKSTIPKGSSVTCDHDRACGRGFYCDLHFNLCFALRHEGVPCRKDSQCARGLDCMFGHCQRSIPAGHEGARCREDKDCSPSMCCAKQHGEMICKRKLLAGDRCYVPDGGLAFSMNELCPCEEGLVCSLTHLPREKEFVYSRSLDWKCAAHSP